MDGRDPGPCPNGALGRGKTLTMVERFMSWLVVIGAIGAERGVSTRSSRCA